MDFSKFSDEQFDVKDWINKSLSSAKTTPLENHVSSLIMKLQLCIQEVNKSLEETSQVALNNIPRVLREVENMRGEASLLKSQMGSVKEDIQSIEESTSRSMKDLVAIDNVKVRMQSAQSALTEADNWAKSTREVSEAISSGDIQQVAEKLIGMQKSLRVLQDAPDIEERQKVLESHKNKLEALLSTQLVQIFNSHNIVEAVHYVKIFEQLERMSHLQTYYSNSHKVNISNAWSTLREGKPMMAWLNEFYDHLLSLWDQEWAWCQQVFAQPTQVLCSVLVQSLSSLQPSLDRCVQESVSEGTNGLKLLIDLKFVTDSFEKHLTATVQDDTLTIQPVIELINAPFDTYLLQYSSMQQSSLMKCIDQLNFEHSDLSDASEIITDSINVVFAAAKEACEACWVFTRGYGINGLHEALQIFFSAYLGKIDNMLSVFRQQTSSADVLWTHFQRAFKIIELCGSLITRLNEYRNSLHVEMSQHIQKVVSRGSDNYLTKCRPSEWDYIMEFNEQLNTHGKDSVMSASSDQVLQLNERAHKFAYGIVFNLFNSQLSQVPQLEIWKEEEKEAVGGDLPKFSLSPQPYITHIGDALLTLPQQLEVYFNEENVSLMLSLKSGKLPYQTDQGAHYNHKWLESFALSACAKYVEVVGKIEHLTKHATRQLLADIDYFCKILSALEIEASKDLVNLQILLEADSENFGKCCENVDDRRLIRSVARLRGYPEP